MTAPYHGGCQCGKIRYVVKGEPLTLYICHCSQCQKQTASAFAMSLTVRSDEFEVTQGLLKECCRPADSGANVFCRFCSECGTRVVHGKDTRPEYINLKPGTLDDTRWLVPVAHIWTSRAQPWVEIGSHYLTYPEQPPDSADMWSRWQAEHTARLNAERRPI